jgi:hypothetical protein
MFYNVWCRTRGLGVLLHFVPTQITNRWFKRFGSEFKTLGVDPLKMALKASVGTWPLRPAPGTLDHKLPAERSVDSAKVYLHPVPFQFAPLPTLARTRLLFYCSRKTITTWVDQGC